MRTLFCFAFPTLRAHGCNNCEPPGRVPEKGRKEKKTTHIKMTTFTMGLYGIKKLLSKHVCEVISWGMNTAAICATAGFTPYWSCAEHAINLKVFIGERTKKVDLHIADADLQV
jgi:hypothetical protein